VDVVGIFRGFVHDPSGGSVMSMHGSAGTQSATHNMHEGTSTMKLVIIGGTG